MHKIPKTFCPLKWDEVVINSQHEYIFACCKATPSYFNGTMDTLRAQQSNLLAGIKDTSCNYCWAIEQVGGKSRRLSEIEKFDYATLPEYNESKPISYLEINLGNECNFQCTYCGPKFSSQWDHDVTKKIYPVFADRYHYAPNENKVSTVEEQTKLIQSFGITKLGIIGGEPLLNKKLWQILESIDVDQIAITTNLSCNTATLDKLLASLTKFKDPEIVISLDSTGDNAEFTRFGLNYRAMLQNIKYVIANAPSHLKIGIHSVMSSITVRDLHNFIIVMAELKELHESLFWNLSPVVNPKIQNFSTLPDTKKEEALLALSNVPAYAKGTAAVINSLASAKFNQTLYAELNRFVMEFSSRHGIQPPLHLINK